MKRLIIISILLCAISLVGYSQSPGVTKSYPLKTLTNTTAATQDFTLTNSYNSLTFQVLCTNLTGTSAGKITIDGSVDGVTYFGLVDTDGYFKGYPNDTLTITNGAIGQWTMNGTALKFYRFKYAPSGSHTTRITAKIIIK
jgi:hypothetical protein